MDSENQFLAQMSLARTGWISLKFILKNFPLVLTVAVAFCLAPDLVTEWVLSTLLNRGGFDATGLSANLLTVLSFQINFLGYSAIAWCVGAAIEGRAPSIGLAVRRFSGRSLIRIVGTLLYATLLMLWPLLAGIGLLVAVQVAKPRSTSLLLFASALSVCAIIVSLGRMLNYCLAEFPAIFENTYFEAAALRSKALVKGRRIWLLGVIILFFVPLFLGSFGLTAVLPDLMRWPPADPRTIYGLARAAYGSLVNAILTAFGIVLQTLLYFRLRREKHDLTFFDLSNTEILQPATKAIGVVS
jgi:hypothetical protein